MSAVDLVLPRLELEEGYRTLPYTDSVGKLTVGYGCNLTDGLTKNAAAALLDAQVNELHSALTAYPWYVALDEPRQSVCLDIAFNAGLHGLLGFPKMLAALAAHDWDNAAAECHVEQPELASRYAALAQILLTGNA